MPRPKIEPDARRTERINPRFTPAELLRIESAASVAGMSASEYVRMQALRGRVVVQQRRELSGEAFDELRRIGVNINQLARIANTTGRAPARLETALETLEQILLREMGDDDAPAPQAAAPKPRRPAWSLKSPARARASRARACIICTTRRPHGRPRRLHAHRKSADRRPGAGNPVHGLYGHAAGRAEGGERRGENRAQAQGQRFTPTRCHGRPAKRRRREQMIEAGRETIKVLGLEGHEILMVAHNDEAAPASAPDRQPGPPGNRNRGEALKRSP